LPFYTGQDLNLRPSRYEPEEIPDFGRAGCQFFDRIRFHHSARVAGAQRFITLCAIGRYRRGGQGSRCQQIDGVRLDLLGYATFGENRQPIVVGLVQHHEPVCSVRDRVHGFVRLIYRVVIELTKVPGNSSLQLDTDSSILNEGWTIHSGRLTAIQALA
jgi:hypothetical protein